MKRFICFIISIFMVSTHVLSQDPGPDLQNPSSVDKPELRIGIWGGYGYSFHNTHYPILCNANYCGQFKKFKGESFSTGIIIDYSIFNSTSWKQILVLRSNFASLPGNTNKPGYTYPSLVEDPEREGEYVKVNSQTKHSLKVQYNILQISALYKLYIFNTGLAICAGPGFNFSYSTNLYNSFYLIYPKNVKFKVSQEGLDKGYRYEDNDRRIVIHDDEIPGTDKFRLSLIAGLEYEINIGNFYIAPGFFADYGFQKFRGNNRPCYNDDWFVHAWYLGMSFLYEL